MRAWTERRIGAAFGLLGGLLILLASLVRLLVGTIDLFVGRPLGAVGAGTEAILWFVVGLLALFFTFLGSRPWRERPMGAGILLLLLAVAGWFALGLGGSLLALLGALFVLLAGALFLVPTR